MQIKDLKVKEVQTIQVLIKSVNVAKNAAQKSYLRFEFVDQTGTIFANKWSVKPEEITLFHPGQVVKVKGLIQLYNTQKQINIETVEPVEGDLDISKYVMASAYPADVLKSNIETFVNQMQEGYYKNIVNAFLSKYETEFYRHPAASRMHHAFISGLAQHVYEMLKIAAVYCDMYEMLNRELVYAGIILHDMGKLFEMTCENLVSTEYTLEGLMVGHISMMVALIDEMSKELECEGEESILLKHMIIAHHGKLEWGSPKEPMIAEAELVHYLDVVSAKMTALETAFKTCEISQMSERVPMLDNRRFYKHK